jgi:hypothetical protein
LRREYASESPGVSRRQERPSISDNRPKLLDKHWTVQELSPKLLDELEVAWERHYGALPPIRRLKRNTTIKPLQINLEEYDEATTAKP